MDYATIKVIHQVAVAVSFAGFFARGLASLRGAAWVRGTLAKTLPHIVDSVLLISALTLAWMLRLSPVATPWLLAKIIALLVYIGLGMIALRPEQSLTVRASAWVAALLTIVYIVLVAITKNPLGWLAIL